MSADKIIGKKTNIIDDQLNAVGVIDEKDPIYDSESEDGNCFYAVMDCSSPAYQRNRHMNGCYSSGKRSCQPPISFDDFAVDAAKIIKDFFVNEECNEVCDSLTELECEQFHDLFVVTAVRTALDYSFKHQKLTSGLLMLLCDRKILTKQHMTRGFEKLVEKASDIKLDVPNAADKLITFIECAIDDKCLDKEYVCRLPETFLLELSSDTLAAMPHVTENLQNLRDYKAKIRDQSKFDVFNEDIDSIQKILDDFGFPYFRHEFVRHLIVSACDRNDRDRETASNILDKLYGTSLVTDDMQLGFARLIGNVEDLQLDSPKGGDLLCKFLLRSIVDDILPPSFLGDSYRLHLGGVKGMNVVKKAQKWLNQRNGKGDTFRFRKIWTGTDVTTTVCQEFKKEIKNTLIEYFDSFDKKEALQLISNMDLTPDQSAEMVRKILGLCMERALKQSYVTVGIELLDYLYQNKEIDTEILIQGFSQTKEMLPEISIDIPNAAQQLEEYIDVAIELNLLPLEFRMKSSELVDDI